MKYYLLNYFSKHDYKARRAPFRGAHLAYAKAAMEQGLLLLGGAYADGDDGAVLLFRAADRGQVEAFAQADPYVQNRVVDDWQIREWDVVIGVFHSQN